MGKLMFFPTLSFSHINVCLTLSKYIFEKYGDKHEIYFVVNKTYKEKLENLCNKLKFFVYHSPKEDDNNYDQKIKESFKIQFFQEFGKNWKLQNRIEFVNCGGHNVEPFLKELILIYPKITAIVQELKPDFIIIDQLMISPVGIDQGIPYGICLSAAPTYFGHSKLPPPRSGLPGEYNEKNVKLWNDFIDKTYRKGKHLQYHNRINEWLKEKKCPNLDNTYTNLVESPYLNIMNYPLELDYETDQVKYDGKWIHLDSAVLKPYPKPFELPEKLINLPGELIYFSLGSMATVYKPLMKRLIKIFQQLPYKFIISTGLIGNEYELGANQYGEKFLNQLSVLQTVDLMISHGGNNSLTECFHFGVPLIILPLFADQIDNGKRIEEKNLGVQLNPFEANVDDFNEAIKKCLAKDLIFKYKEISNRIQKDNGIDKVVEEIVKFLK